MASPSPENWNRLLRSAEAMKALGDHELLDVYRLKRLTNTLSGEKDYSLLAKLALQFNSPAEAYEVTKAGFDAKVLQGDRNTRLLNLAKAASDKSAANLQANLASASKEARGDDLVRLGEYQTGAGKAADAVGTIQKGIAKGVGDQSNARLRLAYAQLRAGQKDAAIRTYNSIKTTPNQAAIAEIWVIYARTGK
jgi:hypothetical protein